MRRSSTTVLVFLAASLLAVVAVLGAGGRTYADRAGQGAPTPPPPPFSGTPVLTTPTPVKTVPAIAHPLTKKQKATAVALVKKDATTRKLVAHKSYKVGGVWLWTTKSGTRIGAIVNLNFKQPVTLKGKFFDLAYDCSEKVFPPYGRVPFKATYKNVSLLTVYVDLGKKRVAGIRPFGVLIGKAVYAPLAKTQLPVGCPS